MPTEAPVEQTKEEIAAAEKQRRADRAERAGDGDLTKPIRYKWDEAQVDALRKTKAKDCSNEEFVVFLEVAARYDLDPFAGQIYAATMGQNKGTAIIVSRDGLLAFAHRQHDFEGMVGDVVRERDEFRVTFDKGERRIHHEWATTMPAEGKTEGHPRGGVIGAWAEVYRKGKSPTFFYAERTEYDTKKHTWAAKLSAMMLKVAESMALRKSFSISGVVGEDEVSKERANLSSTPDEPEWGGNPDVAKSLKDAVEKANELSSGSYRPAKVVGLLAGADPERRREILTELEGFIRQEQATELGE